MLLGRSAFSADSFDEMQRLVETVAAVAGIDRVSFAFSEQGDPTLRDAVFALRKPSVAEIIILPLIVPMESSFSSWLTHSLQRWTAVERNQWPAIRIAQPLGDAASLPALLAQLLVRDATVTLPVPEKPLPNASMIPRQKRRVLVCQGPACNSSGARGIWNHLRNEQRRLKLRTRGDGGTMTALSSCLGPCNLAPVLQVFPEGTYYCGIDETGIDRIVERHLIAGEIVDELAYRPTGRKQKLRP